MAGQHHELPRSQMREQYGPDFRRDIGEPMMLSYLEKNFPSIQKSWWASELPNTVALERNQIDGILSIAAESEKRPVFLGIQLSTGGRTTWLEKIKTWQDRLHKDEVYKLNGEAPAIGALEGDPLPVIFAGIIEEDIDTAWQKMPQRPDWRDPIAPQIAKEAWQFLPRTPEFLGKILESMQNTLHLLAPHYPRLKTQILTAQEAFAAERARIAGEQRTA